MSDFRLFRADGDTHASNTRLRALCRQAERDPADDRIEAHYSVVSTEVDSTADEESDVAPSPVRIGLRERLRRWIPESLLTSRFDLGKAGLLGLAVIVVLGVGVLGVVLLSGGTGSSEPAAPPAPPDLAPAVTDSGEAATSENTTGSDPAESPATPERLVVSVVGRVERPGLVTVQPGDRVADALQAAGGPLPETNVTTLNLARHLEDGEQLHVGIPEQEHAAPAEGDPASEQHSGTETDDRIDLNAASEEELQELPGVGEVTAQHIVRWRTEHGEFQSVDQLQDVDGLGESRVSELRDQVRV